MRPTLTVLHRTDNSERIAFECDHGTTLADHIGGSGDTLRAAFEYVVSRHNGTCRCQPDLIEDLYESLAYMRHEIEADLAVADQSVDPRVLMLSHQHLDSMRRQDCPCDPHVGVVAELGRVTLTSYHRDGCTHPHRNGRTYRMLDFSRPGATA